MVDKRAMDRKWVAEPYDMDTALGINNSGILSYGYSLQDTDQVDAEIAGGDDQGSKDVFNAQNSVLWMNIRDAYRDQIVSMYQSLRSGGKFNYLYIEQYFENHQSKWPEALVNEDSYVKYITPLIKPVTEEKDEVTGKTIFVTTSKYLKMLLGLKTQQRRRWLYNRFRFTDSKYLLGDAAANTIGMRLFHDGTLTVTPALDLYVSVRFGLGSTPRQVQATAGTPIDFAFENPSGTKDMETVIYSADLITDLGDLSVFYPNEIDLSYATRLRRLKIGSGEEGYSNGRLNTINISNKPVLEYLDLRNCPNLAEGFDLEGSPRLEEAYFDGTAITGVDLAEGCSIEHLHLPDTITALTLMDLDKLTDLQLAGLSKVERCMISNVSSSVADPISIVEQLQPGTLVYLDGFDIELADDAAIGEFIDFLDTMKGVTRTRGANGRWAYTETEKAQVRGVIHVDTTTGAMAKQLKDKYPYITLDFKHISCTVTFHNYNGTSVLQTKTSSDGAAVTYTGSTPTKPQSDSHTFTFSGWAYQIDGVKNDNALKNVTEDRDLYPAFTSQLRTFTVTFKNWDNSTLQTVNNVPYGSDAEYTGSTPTNNGSGETADFEFIGWSPEPINIVGATTCVAQFKDVSSIVLKLLSGTLTEVNDTEGFVESIGIYGLGYLPDLNVVNLPAVKQVSAYAFHESPLSNSDLLSLPMCDTVVPGSFQGLRVKTLSLPKITTLPSSVFDNGGGSGRSMRVRHYDLPLVEQIPDYCFRQNTYVLTIDAPSAKEICTYGLNGCRSLTTANFPSVEIIGSKALSSCTALTSLNIDACKQLGSAALSGLSHIAEFTLKYVEIIPAMTFSGWNNLTKLDLWAVKSIDADRVFQYCTELTTLIIRQHDTVVSLGSSSAFSDCPNVQIYVPDDLLASYKEATNWVTYAENIKPISEVPE